MAQAVIMAGGQGERFWPMTHENFPKYLLRWEGKQSLLQGTYRRLLEVYPKKNIHVVTTCSHKKFIQRELSSLPEKNIIFEPSRNNTTAAIYLSCAQLGRRFGPEEVLCFFPADHLIQDRRKFARTMEAAIRLAQAVDLLVAVGIKPVFPATGYGYIEVGKPLRGSFGAYRVSCFVEKPDEKKARAYLRNGKYLWNAGIFTWRAGVFQNSMNDCFPAFVSAFDLRRLSSSYRRLPCLSIDYALLEKAKNIAVCKTTMDWCDMGSWDMFYDKSKKDRSGNVVQGPAEILGCERSLFVNSTKHPLVVFRKKDLIAVRTKQGTLVCPRGCSERAARSLKKA